MPPAKSMVNQEMLLYSGLESSAPSRIRPYRLRASSTRKSNHRLTPMMKNQPRLVTIQVRAVVKTSCVCDGRSSSRTRNTTMQPAATKKMVGSVFSRSRVAQRSSVAGGRGAF